MQIDTAFMNNEILEIQKMFMSFNPAICLAFILWILLLMFTKICVWIFHTQCSRFGNNEKVYWYGIGSIVPTCRRKLHNYWKHSIDVYVNGKYSLVNYLEKNVHTPTWLQWFSLGSKINVIFFSLFYAFLHFLKCQKWTFNEFKI